jgi:SH3-like domain-containing protein
MRPLPILTLLVALLAAAGEAAPAAEPTRPTQRLESLADDVVYGRRGPGQDHKIDWTYTRKGLPVMVLEESEAWRRVRDPEGGEVWMHASMLSRQRTVFVKSAGVRGELLLKSPRPGAKPVARVGAGVVGRLEECLGGWRKVSVDGKQGWIAQSVLWGADECPNDRQR